MKLLYTQNQEPNKLTALDHVRNPEKEIKNYLNIHVINILNDPKMKSRLSENRTKPTNQALVSLEPGVLTHRTHIVLHAVRQAPIFAPVPQVNRHPNCHRGQFAYIM